MFQAKVEDMSLLFREKNKRLYHDMPFEGLRHFKSKRDNTRNRIEQIIDAVEVKDKTILDIGCDVGGISFGMVEAGAKKVIGIDNNEEDIKLAKKFSEFLKFNNSTDFKCETLDLAWAKQMQHFDIIIWLSQLHHIIRKEGLDYGKQLLFEVSKHADLMVFEMEYFDQRKLKDILYDNTLYTRMHIFKQVDKWRKSKRNLFVLASRRDILDSTNSSEIERIDYNKVKKTFKRKNKGTLGHEVKALIRLASCKHFPKIYEIGDDYLVMEYVGTRVKNLKPYRSQALEILSNLNDYHIIHRDAKSENFLVKDGILYLIDFSTCLFTDEEDSIKVPLREKKFDLTTLEELFGKMSILEEKIKAIPAKKYGGSSVRRGRLYHDLPFGGLDVFPSHRKRSKERVYMIKCLAGAKNKTILDLGCSVGGIVLGMINSRTEKIMGIDYDEESIEVAKEVSKKLGYRDRSKFICADIDIDLIRKLPEFDLVMWLSQWMWSVKQRGLEYAKELLFEVSKKAKVMVFESAANDGMAKIKGSTQDDIERWLNECAVHDKITRHKGVGGWMNRDTFVCKAPVVRLESTKRAASSIIERISKDRIKKTYRTRPKNCLWMQEREVEALKRLEKYDHFPKLLEEGKGYIVMNYVGRHYGITLDMADQGLEILESLKQARIHHRDVIDRNLLHLNKKLYLIDFGWCIFDDEKDTPIRAPSDVHLNLPDDLGLISYFSAL